MTITNGYTTLARLKDRMDNQSSGSDTNLEEAIESASREIDGNTMCGRQFYKVTDVRRIASPYGGYCLWVPDIVHSTITSVKIDTTDDGTFDATWVEGTDFVVEPYAGELSAGVQFPITQLIALGSAWPSAGRRPRRVEISADFGWAAIPDPIRQACLELAAFRFKLKDAALGVAGFGEFGDIKIKDLPTIKKIVQPYARRRLGFA